MKNFEWLNKHGYKVSSVNFDTIGWQIAGIKENLKEANKDAVPVLKKYLEWLDEEHNPILTGDERSYLEAVIKPYKDKVDYIKKHANLMYEWIVIELEDEENMIQLPACDKGTTYKDMEFETHYTLDQMGL